MKCWYDGNISCQKDCELIENCGDRERMLDIRADAIEECIKLLDVCTCENCDECSDKEYNKKMCEHEAIITYENIIKKLEQLKEK